MTFKDEINARYFDWMYEIGCGRSGPGETSYRKLLSHLHDIEFIFFIPKDENRADDGLALRYRFAYEYPELANGQADYYISGPCSVLEMMIALAIRCEVNIMDDPNVGDRTSQWFWGMVSNLGLSSMTDSRYDELYVNDVISRFLNRRYSRDGEGGLFRVKDAPRDMRDVEIWFQLCWYLDSIT